MKKIIFGLFAAILAVGFTACDKDDKSLDVNVANLIGKWQLSSITATENGQTYTDSDLDGNSEILIFNADGTGSYIWANVNCTVTFSYELDGNKIRFNNITSDKSGDIVAEIESMLSELEYMSITQLTATNLVFSVSESYRDDDGQVYNYSMTLTFVKI